MPRKKTNFDFEAALKELEGLVERMEKGELPLEESLQKFERGIELTRSCQKALQEAEQKVQVSSMTRIVYHSSVPPCDPI